MNINALVESGLKKTNLADSKQLVHFDDITPLIDEHAEQIKSQRSIYDEITDDVKFSSFKPRIIDGIELFKVVREMDSEPVFLLKHPKTNEFFEISQDLFQIVRRFNGNNTIEQLFLLYFETNGSLASEKIQNLVKRMDTLGFLKHISVNLYESLTSKLEQKEIKGKIFTIRNYMRRHYGFKHFNAFAGFLNKIGFGLLFNWVFFLAAMGLVGYGLGTWLLEVGAQKYDLLRVGGDFTIGLVVYLLIKVLLVMFHQITQAIYLKKLGHKIPDAGVFFRFGVPYLYVNSNYLALDSKKHRLIFAGLGPLSNILIGSAAFGILSFNFFPYDSIISDIIYKFGVLGFITAIIKLHPLIRYDGYYILSELLKTNRLIERSNEFFFDKFWAKLFTTRKYTRQEIVLAVYGALGLIWTILFIAISVRVVQKKIVPIFNDILSSGLLALSLYIIMALVIVIPIILSLIYGIFEIVEKLIKTTYKFIHYQSLKFISYVMLSLSIGIPILLQFAPPIFGQNIQMYYVLCRFIAVASLIGVFLLSRSLKSKWLDKKSLRIWTMLGWASIIMIAIQLISLLNDIKLGLVFISYEKAAYWYEFISVYLEFFVFLMLFVGMRGIVASIQKFSNMGILARMLFSQRIFIGILVVVIFSIIIGQSFDIEKLRYFDIVRLLPLWFLVEIIISLGIYTYSVGFSKILPSFLSLLISFVAFLGSLLIRGLNEQFNLMDIVQNQYYSLEAGGSLLAFSAIAIAMLIVQNMNFKVYDEKFRQQFVFTDQSALKLVVGKLLWSIMQNIDVLFGRFRLEYVQQKVEYILNQESKEKTKIFKKRRNKSEIKEGESKDIAETRYQSANADETTLFGQAVSNDELMIEKEIEHTINQKLESFSEYLDSDELDVKFTPEQLEIFKESILKKLGFDLASEILRVFKKKIKHFEYEKVVNNSNRVVGHIEIAEFGIMNLRDTNLDLIQLGRYLRSLLNKAIEEIEENFGNTFLKRIIVNIYDKLSWEERELIHTFLLFDRESELNLRHYRDEQLSADGLRTFLMQIPVFADFANDEIQALINKFAEENYPADSEIIKIGELSSRFYIILKGRVQVQQEESHILVPEKSFEKQTQKHMINIAFLRRGDFFGEQSLLANSPNTSTIVTIEPTTLLSLDKSDFVLFANQFRMVQQKLNVAFEFVELLEEMEVFRELSSQRVREISVRMKPGKYAKGELIINEGEEGDAFYVIKKGIVDVFKNYDTDDEQMLSEMKRGEYFGEISMLKKSPRTATVVAKTKVELLRLDKLDFDELLGEYLSPNSVLQRTVWRRSADTVAKTTIIKHNDD